MNKYTLIASIVLAIALLATIGIFIYIQVLLSN